jgi:hypothetical protein
VGDLAVDFFEERGQTSKDREGRPQRAVVERVAPENSERTERLRGDQTLHEAGVYDEDTLRVLPELVAGGSFEAPAEKSIQFFALARALLEEGDKAVVNKTYTIQAGLSPQEIEGFISESMDVPVNKHDELIAIDILCHESEHIELLSDWQATIYYRADQRTAQFVEFLFRALKPGQASISIDFYHKQRWLRTISFEFEAVEAPQPVSAQPEE